MSDKLKKVVNFEMSQLHRLLDEYRPFLDSASKDDINGAEKMVLGGILHSFYNGIENIFKRIDALVDGRTVRGAAWHRELLDSMASKGRSRPAVISQSLRDRLDDYLRFRHLFRYSYSFELNIREMAPLVADCRETLNQLETELNKFLKR